MRGGNVSCNERVSERYVRTGSEEDEMVVVAVDEFGSAIRRHFEPVDHR